MKSSDESRPVELLAGPEAEMFRKVLAGEEFCPGPAGPGQTEGWGEEQTIRARVLCRLLADKNLHPKGVRLRNVRIIGQLDLRSATLRRPLRLKDCCFDSLEPVILDYAKVSLLILDGCKLSGLNGDTLMVTTGLELTGSRFTGPVMLPDAKIRGHFRCTNAQLNVAISDTQAIREYGGRYALVGDGMEVSGDVRLNGTNPGGDIRHGGQFTAVGVLLSGAHIGGTLDCRGARLRTINPAAASNKNYCLRGSGLKVDGDVILDNCTTEGGGIRLSDADIAGELLCHGTQLNGADKGGNALRANELKVGSNVFFIDGFTADGGKISLKQAVIGGDLQIEAKRLGEDKDRVAFDATGTQVTQRLVWLPESQVHGKVILERVVVGQVQDSWTGEDDRRRPNGYWPANGMLRLDGLTYGGIRSVPYDEKVGANERLEWIRSQYESPAKIREAKKARRHDKSAHPAEANYATQPYRQLANVYLGAGRDADARTVAIAQRRDLRGYGNLTPSAKFGNWLLDNTIRYGYRTWHAAVALAILYAAVVTFFWYARFHNALIAVQVTPDVTSMSHLTASACTPIYPCFNPFGYAIDTVIPLINVHQTDFWAPNAHASRPWDWLSVWVTYVSTGLGWLFATLAVAGYTGLARNSSAP